MVAEQGSAVFHRADVLYALEWAAVAPGLGRWGVLLDNAEETRLVSVLPPGSDVPAFLIFRAEGHVLVIPRSTRDGSERVRRFRNLREAVLAICPLDDEKAVAVNEAMEVLYPRSFRSGRPGG
jgi:hypothetical protein